MAKTICSFLSPMRNGTTVLTASLFRHPQILGINGLVERSVHSRFAPLVANKIPTIIDFYPALLESIAHRERSEWGKKTITPIVRQGEQKFMTLVERNHIPVGLPDRLKQTDFKILILVRDPREVILSHKKWWDDVKEKMLRIGRTEKMFVQHGMTKWLQAAEAYYLLRETNDLMLVRHEEICAAPRVFGHEILTWLEVDSSEQRIDEFAEIYKPSVERRHEDSSYESLMTEEVVSAAKTLGFTL